MKKFRLLNDCDSPKKVLDPEISDLVSMKSLFKEMEPVIDHRIKKSVDSKTLSCRWVM